MKTRSFYLSLIVVAIAGMSFLSCSKEPKSDEESGTDPKYDDLELFQDYFVHLDRSGNFAGRFYGTPLDPSDTTVLYIGVDDLAEACDLFLSWCGTNDNIDQSSEGKIQFNPTDINNKSQGTIVFNTLDTGGETMAQVTFSENIGLKYFSKIIFIPADSQVWGKWHSPYKFGDVTKRSVPIIREDGNYVCIRQAKPGQKGLCVFFSNNSGFVGDADGCSWACTAHTISQMFTANGQWESFVKLFKEKADTKLRTDAPYWIDKWRDGWVTYRYSIWLKEDREEWWAMIKRPYKPMMHDFQFDISE